MIQVLQHDLNDRSALEQFRKFDDAAAEVISEAWWLRNVAGKHPAETDFSGVNRPQVRQFLGSSAR